MNRREFLHRSAALAAAATAMAQDPDDRSPARDPIQVQRSTLVVEGLVAGGLRDFHLRAQIAGGVNCGVQGGVGDWRGWADNYRFLDKHKDQLVRATTVREIRVAHAAGKIANVFNWQSAEALGYDFNDPLNPPVTSLRA